MRLKYIFTVLILVVFCLVGGVQGEEGEKQVQLPPASLAQWYTPIGKRQIWLHNMFKLRREMQAVTEYLTLEDQPRLRKWADRLVEHYRKIGDMAPEWRDELEQDEADALQRAAEDGRFEDAARAVRRLGLSCRSCHREYRAVTAAFYRTPDFSKIQVEDSETLVEETYAEVMKRLSVLVNRIKIASEDERSDVALDTLFELERRMDDLSTSCTNCHKEEAPRERILGKATDDLLAGLQAAVQKGAQKEVGRKLGGMAVIACARCHGVHRTLYDLKRTMAE